MYYSLLIQVVMLKRSLLVELVVFDLHVVVALMFVAAVFLIIVVEVMTLYLWKMSCLIEKIGDC